MEEEEMVAAIKKTSKRRGPVKRRNFVQENIAFLRELQTSLREKKTEATAVVRTRRKSQNQKTSKSSKIGATPRPRKHAQIGKHAARKAKKSPKCQPYTANDNAGKIDLKLTTEEKLLLKGYDSLIAESTSDAYSNVSSTDNEADTIRAAQEAGTSEVKTSTKPEEIKSPSSLEGKEVVRARSPTKTAASAKQSSIPSPSGEDTENSLAFSLTKQPSIKMTAKAMAAREKVLAPSTADPLKAPPTYKRGVVPRYLRSQKKEQQKEEDEELFNSQQGYVPLPNETRKEVLTMLRKSFADLAHQLNMLPIRPPNMEIRERRTDIEKQLNKLEEAIQVFSQIEVSVKLAIHRKEGKSV